MESRPTIQSPNAAPQCLHLSRSGERCQRPALEDGFCELHGPDAVSRFNTAARRRLFAILLGAAILWPILVDLWHALQRLRH
ncbi:MAG: DUF5763 domain-containing protein [Candidatus Acidiferrales bacterium]